MPTLRVPNAHRAALQDLARLSDSQVEALIEYFASISPAQSKILEDIQSKCGVSPDVARSLIAALGGLVDLKSNSIWFDTIVEQVSLDSSLDLAEDERAQLRRHLANLMVSPAITRVAKAMVLQVEHANIFRDARMFSDFRPVLEETFTSDPHAVVLSHTLKIEYIDQNERINRLFVVLDNEDLHRLHEVVERELEKLESLDGFAERLNLSRFDFWGGS